MVIDDPSGSCCPELYVWDGTILAYDSTFNLNETEALYEHELTVAPQSERGFYYLQIAENLSSQIDYISFYGYFYTFQVKLPLLTAWHSRLGRVNMELFSSDDWRVNMEANDTINLTYLALPLTNLTFALEGSI